MARDARNALLQWLIGEMIRANLRYPDLGSRLDVNSSLLCPIGVHIFSFIKTALYHMANDVIMNPFSPYINKIMV